MIDRPQGGEQAVLVHINFPAGNMQEDLLEFKELALSAGAIPVAVVTGNRQVPDPKYFIGTGKAEEIRALIKTQGVEIVLFNHALSPAQERNLEKLFECRVLDRTGLILDIFAQRARSFEGKLQVELALLRHLATRLVRGWTHLERQRGGIGLRGPGETQLETDRRLIRARIQIIEKRLLKVREQREQGRRARHKATIPTVALVGYTNAGKSTLFKLLSGENVYIANQLFATLDPTLRRVHIPEMGPIILADTVGFIRHLPHDLIDAFRATLEEVCEADLLLHVVDMHDAKRQANIDQVNTVLESIGANKVLQILVYNKLDLCDENLTHLDNNQNEQVLRVRLSAVTGVGLPDLQALIAKCLSHTIVERNIILQSQDAKLRAELYRLGGVLSETIDPEGRWHLSIKLPKVDLEKLFR